MTTLQADVGRGVVDIGILDVFEDASVLFGFYETPCGSRQSSFAAVY